MKRQILKLGLLALFIAVSSCSGDENSPTDPTNPTPDPINYVLGGAGPGGGVIFYLDSDGHGYEMAGTLGTAKWQNVSDLGQMTNISGLGVEVGTGKANTSLIVNTLGNGVYAAKLCADFEQGGFDDWFLPSRDEVKEMYNYFHTCGCDSGVNPINNYWSSSQGSNAGMAWNTDFMVNVETTQFNNWTFELQKNQEVFVKPIRQF